MRVLADTAFSKSLKLALTLTQKLILLAVYQNNDAALTKILARAPPLLALSDMAMQATYAARRLPQTNNHYISGIGSQSMRRCLNEELRG